MRLKYISVVIAFLILCIFSAWNETVAEDSMKAFYVSSIYKKLINKEYDKAIEQCGKLRKLKLSKDYVCFLEGFAYYNKGDYTQAVSSFTDAIWMNKNRGDAWYWRANTYRLMGKLDKALKSVNQAIQLQDTIEQLTLFNKKLGFSDTPYLSETNLYWLRSTIYMGTGEYENALKDVDHAIKVRKYAADYLMVLKGHIFYRQNQLADALNAFKIAVEKNKNLIEAWNMMGIIEFNLGNYESSITYCRQAYELNTSFEQLKSTIALDEWMTGNREESIKLIMQAAAKNPGANKYYHLGYFYHVSGDQQKALEYFQLAVQSNADILKSRKELLNRPPESSPTFSFYQDEYTIAKSYIETGKTPDAVVRESRPVSVTISSLKTHPSPVPARVPFKITVSFQPDIPSDEEEIEAVFSFKIRQDSRTLFTSNPLTIKCRNRDITHYQARMSPVPKTGTYTIEGYVTVQDVTDTRTATLLIE